MNLSPEELERYARHIVLSDIGGPGQQKLKSARVLVVGAGGLGSPVLQYLAAAGVGTIGIIDADIVSLSNLQRQTIHDTNNLDMVKVKSASKAIARINPNVEVQTWPIRIDGNNGAALIRQYDIVADGSDNFDTRYVVADLCEELKRPLVTAAVGRFDASITTLKPYLEDEDGNLNPRYTDIFPRTENAAQLPTCAETGILGALTGVIGSMQALEIIKEITGAGEGLVGKLCLYDSLAARFETIEYARG